MEDITTFDMQGFLVVRDFLDAALVGKLTSIVDRVQAQWLQENRAEYVERGLVNMHSLTDPRYFKDQPSERTAFFECLAAEKMTKLVERMFGSEIYFHNTQLFFTPSDRKKLPYWHRDLQFSPIDDDAQAKEQRNLLSLHVRIPLIRETGVELIAGTHRRWDTELEADVRFERNGHRNSEELPGAVLIEVDPGDVLLFDAQMIHRGNYHLNVKRKALDLCIGKPHPFTSACLDKSVLPDEQEMTRIANNDWYRCAKDVTRR